MVDEFIKLRSSWQKVSGNPMNFLDIGVGITTDDVIIGTVGSGKVQDFTAIGTTVNLAAAFEKEARGGRRILVDNPTYEAVMDMVAPIDDDVDRIRYHLKQPDQITGNYYYQYHIKELVVKKEPAVKSHRVFISYNESDLQFVEHELIPLLKKNNVESWYSKKIRGGDIWVDSITDAIGKCDWMLVIVSKASANAEWVKTEVKKAPTTSPREKNNPFQLNDKTSLEDGHPLLPHKQTKKVKTKKRSQ